MLSLSESTFVCLKNVFILTRLGVAERVSEREGLWVGGWAEGWDHVSGLEFFLFACIYRNK